MCRKSSRFNIALMLGALVLAMALLVGCVVETPAMKPTPVESPTLFLTTNTPSSIAEELLTFLPTQSEWPIVITYRQDNQVTASWEYNGLQLVSISPQEYSAKSGLDPCRSCDRTATRRVQTHLDIKSSTAATILRCEEVLYSLSCESSSLGKTDGKWQVLDRENATLKVCKCPEPTRPPPTPSLVTATPVLLPARTPTPSH